MGSGPLNMGGCPHTGHWLILKSCCFLWLGADLQWNQCFWNERPISSIVCLVDNHFNFGKMSFLEEF